MSASAECKRVQCSSSFRLQVTRTLLAVLLRNMDLTFLAIETMEFGHCSSSGDAGHESAEEDEERDVEEGPAGCQAPVPPRRVALPAVFAELGRCLNTVRRELVHRHQVRPSCCRLNDEHKGIRECFSLSSRR